MPKCVASCHRHGAPRALPADACPARHRPPQAAGEAAPTRDPRPATASCAVHQGDQRDLSIGPRSGPTIVVQRIARVQVVPRPLDSRIRSGAEGDRSFIGSGRADGGSKPWRGPTDRRILAGRRHVGPAGGPPLSCRTSSPCHAPSGGARMLRDAAARPRAARRVSRRAASPAPPRAPPCTDPRPAGGGRARHRAPGCRDSGPMAEALEDAGLAVACTRLFFGCATGVRGHRPPT